MKIKQFIEYQIDANLHEKITLLKKNSFPGYEKPRSYYKQLPHFRFLVFEGDRLIAHMGIDHPVISVGDEVFTI